MNSIHELAGVYAVDALDDVERARFERHLVGCSECQRQVEMMRRAMLDEIEPVAPSADLKERVMTAIEEAPQVEVIARPTRPRWVPVLVAAVVALVLAIGGLAGSTQRRITAVLTAADVVEVSLDVTDPGRGQVAEARLAYSIAAEGAVLLLTGLDEIASDRTYEAWVIPAGADPIPAGLFIAGGSEEDQVLLKADVEAGVVVAITEEPAGGVDAPTGEILVAGEV